MACVRAAWLVMGASTIQLENVPGGWSCEELDLGYPAVRAVTSPRPDVDGIDDRTRLMGERAVSASIHAVATGGASIDQIAASFAPFMVPSARPVLHYVLDRPGAAERIMTVRAAGYTWPIAGPIERQVHLQWIAPDPIAYDPTQRSATAYSGSTTAQGRVYNLTFNRTYASGGGGAATADLYTPGDITARPLLRIYGPVSAPTVLFSGGNGFVGFQPTLGLNAGQYVEVDCAAHTAYLNGDRSKNVLTLIDWTNIAANGGWPRIPPLTHVTMSMSGQSTGGTTQTTALWSDGYLA